MTPEAIRSLIEREVAGNWSLTNLHGCDLRRCLVSPELKEYDDCGGGRPLVEPYPVIYLWLVLEELPDDPDGYKIVYGEQTGMFGLAVSGSARDIFIGYYGTFLETYESM